MSGDVNSGWLAAEENFARFAPAIGWLAGARGLTREVLLGDPFLLHAAGRMTVSYAPFDDVNRAARVAVVGITPGWSETRIAFEVAACSLRDGIAHERILREVKRSASFAGSMRRNLVQMLDDVGVAVHLGLQSCEQLYSLGHEHLLHNTAVLRYPVFVGRRNYTGHGPAILANDLLRQMALRILAPELADVPNAFIVPLGVAVEEALRFLAREGLLDEARCLLGFPHPSGANGHRWKQFAANRRALAARVDDWFTGRRYQPIMSSSRARSASAIGSAGSWKTSATRRS